jgi:hypothetical protein
VPADYRNSDQKFIDHGEVVEDADGDVRLVGVHGWWNGDVLSVSFNDGQTCVGLVLGRRSWEMLADVLSFAPRP